MDTPEAWKHYRMLILELPWLEEQTNHLLYLQAMEMLLNEFLLVHAPCFKDLYFLALLL